MGRGRLCKEPPPLVRLFLFHNQSRFLFFPARGKREMGIEPRCPPSAGKSRPLRRRRTDPTSGACGPASPPRAPGARNPRRRFTAARPKRGRRPRRPPPRGEAPAARSAGKSAAPVGRKKSGGFRPRKD